MYRQVIVLLVQLIVDKMLFFFFFFFDFTFLPSWWPHLGSAWKGPMCIRGCSCCFSTLGQEG